MSEEELEAEWADALDAEMAWWRTKWHFDATGVVVIDRPEHQLD